MLRSWLSIPKNNPELAQAQVAAFHRQIPLLYFILLVDTTSVAVTHFDVAPWYLTLLVPAVLYVICIIRFVSWLGTRGHSRSDAEAIAKLKGTMVMAVVLGLAFEGWSLMLLPYGDVPRQMHVAYYMSMTVMGSIFCLMHLRAAAMALALAVGPPIVVVFCLMGGTIFIALAVNFALVTLALLYVLQSHYRDFANLIDSRKELLERTEAARSLSEANIRLANLDSLTGLSNRRRFLTELELRTTLARASGGAFVVGMIDLDGFKPVNDAYGHAIGDKVLQEAARRLASEGGDEIFVARLGGDEFGLIIDGNPADDTLTDIGERLCEALRQPFLVSGVVAKVSGSVGFARFPASGDTPDVLFERADYALYFAKQHHRGHAVIFSEEHEAKLIEQARVEQALQTVDPDREMFLVFQPVFDTEDHRTLAFEALARWHHAKLGPISPALFITVAERTGQIGRLTDVLLKKALEAAAAWPADVRLSFNLSAYDVSSKGLARRIENILAAQRFPASRIDFEITETAAMKDAPTARANLDALIDLGASVALDDFGTGQSNLAYIHQLPLSKIKIDRSFIAGLKDSRVSRDVIRTIIDLSRNLGCSCVVEGVETAEQVLIVKTLGCRVIQGHYYGKPMTAEEALARIEAERSPDRMSRQQSSI